MAASFKKILLVLVTLLLGVMSAGAYAQTNYDFSQTANYNNWTKNYGVNTGTTPDGSAMWFGDFSSHPASFGISTLTTAGQTYSVAFSTYSTDPGTLNNNITLSVNGATLYNGTNIPNVSNNFIESFVATGPTSSFLLTGFDMPAYAVISSISVSAAVGAPEIDGSLAPKVGFLLGCLFLMFGRKKQDEEPMMIA